MLEVFGNCLPNIVSVPPVNQDVAFLVDENNGAGHFQTF
jgi:hypothetical protein